LRGAGVELVGEKLYGEVHCGGGGCGKDLAEGWALLVVSTSFSSSCLLAFLNVSYSVTPSDQHLPFSREAYGRTVLAGEPSLRAKQPCDKMYPLDFVCWFDLNYLTLRETASSYSSFQEYFARTAHHSHLRDLGEARIPHDMIYLF